MKINGGSNEGVFWICRQWSWPVQLPVQFFGIFPTGGVITDEDQTLPWSDELEHKIFVSDIGQYPAA